MEKWAGNGDISAGNSIDLATDTQAGTDESEAPWPVLTENDGTLNVVWESSDTDSSSIIADYDYDIEDYDDWPTP